jgi:hypothetical protein
MNNNSSSIIKVLKLTKKVSGKTLIMRLVSFMKPWWLRKEIKAGQGEY